MNVRVVASKLSRKPLYLEADHAFVDLFLCFLHLPLAFIFQLLSIKDSCLPQVGCISNVYQSLCTLIDNRPRKEASGLPYIITDDFNIIRVSNTMENLQLLSKLKATNMMNLNKVETSITVDEALEPLKCSFMSKTALNKVFGRKVSEVAISSSMLSQGQIVPVSSTSISVRFLVRRCSREIVYMEAGDEFFDMVERFLNTPIAWLMNKFSKGKTVGLPKIGSISNVYSSVYMLSADSLLVPQKDFMHPTFEKARFSPNILISLLRGAASEVYTCSWLHGVTFLYSDECFSCKESMTHKLKALDSASILPIGKHVYKCKKSIDRCPYVSYSRSKWCISCGEMTTSKIPLVMGGHTKWTLEPTKDFQGYVQKHLSFMVSNNLEIIPASSINNIGMLNKLMAFRVENIHSFEASITVNEVLELLKASFTTEEALDSVFGKQTDRSIPQASTCECLDFLLHWLTS